MLSKATPAPLPDFNMNVSVGPTTDAFTVETPPTPLISGLPELPEAAVELVMSGALPIRAGVVPATIPATGAGVASGPDEARPPAPPAAPELAVPLVGSVVLP